MYFCFMVYCIDTIADEPILLLNRHIGFDEEDGMGIDGALFQQELLQLDALGKKRIQVWINSPGGVVTDGYNIFSAILKSKTPVDTYCIGAAASIAGVIFQAGRKRIISDYGWLMYHNAFGGDNKQILDVMNTSIGVMVSRSGMSEEDVRKLMDRVTYINAKESVSLGLADSIEESTNSNTKYLKKITEPKDFHREVNKVLNSIIINQNQKTMFPKVTNRLNLNDAATEDSVIKAIDEIENRAVIAESKLKEVQDKGKASEEKLAKLKEELDAAKKAYEDCKDELDGFKKKSEEEEMKGKEEKAKNLINEAVKVGRISNKQESIDKWVNLAKNDFDSTKAMIDELPLNKVAPTIETEANKLKDGEVPTNALYLMAQIQNKNKK